jgi:hypothetical protein
VNTLPVRFGIPVSSVRFVGAAVTAVGFGVLVYLVSMNLYRFTLVSGVYLAWGVTSGVITGLFETRLVLSQIKNRTIMWLWRMSVAFGVLVLAPFLFVLLVYGGFEGASFLVYAALPVIPVFLGVSGYQYHKYEKQNNVKVFGAPYGFEFWTEPVVSFSDKFYFFLRDIQVKNASTMWHQIRYAKTYQKELNKHPDIDDQTRQCLTQLLETFSRYHVASLTILLTVSAGFPLILAFSFTGGFGLLELPLNQIMNVTLPLIGVLLITFFASTAYLVHSFNKKTAKMLRQINPDKLYIAKT